jgi:hypothetical protein
MYCFRTRLLAQRLKIFIILLMISCAPVSSLAGDSQSRMQLAFFFWHRKGSNLNISEYDPKYPQRYEYLMLEEWSPNGWKPSKIDIALEFDSAGKMKLSEVSSFHVSLSLRVGPLKGDPTTKITDFKGLEANAVWLPAHLARTVPRGSLPIATRLILIKDYNIESLTIGLWKKNLWPVELKARVSLEPLKPEQLKESVISRNLRIIPGD